MEQWEAVIKACPTPIDLKFFSKAVQTAGVVLKQDLAPFEIEWILQTLLHKPVSLLETVRSQHTTQQWFKAIGDAFRLLSTTCTTWKDACEPHFEDIVALTSLPLEPQPLRPALACLSSAARACAVAARALPALLRRLENATACRASLATAIGVICECHPEAAQDSITLIWRVYLNMLDSDKTNVQAVLEGILGVFTHFGTDLPTAELVPFYEKLSNDYIFTLKCKQVCQKILIAHASIFREQVAKDDRLRLYLWEELRNSTGNAELTAQAITAVYDTVCLCVDKDSVQKIAAKEIIPNTSSPRLQTRYTALRILRSIERRFSVDMGTKLCVDPHSLEFELRDENVSYDVAEAVSYCIESNLDSSADLLQSAIMFYDHLPANRRRDIVVHGLLSAPDDVRTAATIFLISETTAEESSLDEHLGFWKDLFDSNGGRDAVVMEKSNLVFEDFMNHTIFALDGFLEENNETIPAKLLRLLTLASHMYTFQPKDHTSDHYDILLTSLMSVAREYYHCIDVAIVKTLRCLLMHVDQTRSPVKEICQMVPLASCADEPMLCEVCLLYLQAPLEELAVDELALALKLIFSRGDVESAVLSAALKKLEELVISGSELDKGILQSIIQRVHAIRHTKNFKEKDDRILNRDIIMFIGKFGRQTNEDINNSASDMNLIKLIDTFALSLPNPDEGVRYKIPLSRFLNVALRHADPDVLQKILAIICAQLTSHDDDKLQQAMASACAALCAAHVRGSSSDARAIQAALLYCRSTAAALLYATYITEEISPGVRRMLSDGLEAVLLQDRDDVLVPFVWEHASVLLSGPDSNKKRAGIDITEALLTALKQNNGLCVEHLPNILKLVAKSTVIGADRVFKMAAEIYMEKIELFDNKAIRSLVKDLFLPLMRNNFRNTDRNILMSISVKIFIKIFSRLTEAILDFSIGVFQYKDWEKNELLDIIFEVFDEERFCGFITLFIMSVLPEKYDLDGDSRRNLLTKGNCKVIDIFFRCNFYADHMSHPDFHHFDVQNGLRFLQNYSDVLLEVRSEGTLEQVARFIRRSINTTLSLNRRGIEKCLPVYTKNQVPAKLQTAFEEWCTYNFKDIITDVDKEDFTHTSMKHRATIAAFKIMQQFFDVTTLTDLAIAARKWPKIILKLFSSDCFAYLKPQIPYLTDLLSVSAIFMTVTDVKSLLSEGCQLKGLPGQKTGEDFCRFFMNVFFDMLVKKPYVLLDADDCCLLINDAVRYSLKKKCTGEQYDDILELVVAIWSTYVKKATFNQKHSLLLDLSNYPRKLDASSEPMAWAIGVIYSDARAEDKARVVAVLPGGEAFSSCYREFASELPVRLSEMEGKTNVCFRALLDSLVRTGDHTLLNVVMNLADGDNTKGWWDDAIDSCMVSLAVNADLALLKAVYTRAREGLSSSVCSRVLLPLLRYSSSLLCETFYASLLSELLRINAKVPVGSYRFQEFIVDYTRTLKILELAFQKIPSSSIESVRSNLYKEVASPQSWHMVKATCKLCLFLTLNVKPPAGSDDRIKEDFRLLHTAIYNCFSAAITLRRPDENLYDYILGVTVWDRLIDDSKEYSLKIRPLWEHRTKLQPVSIGVEGAASDLASFSLSHTLRTKMFVRTLSENPFVFDFTKEEMHEEINNQEIRLPSNELNAHECAATLTALLCHLSAAPLTKWRAALTSALRGGKRNTKWLLAQIICNCKEELKPHSEALSAALLEVVVSTPVSSGGKMLLQGLHVDILETIVHWDPTLGDSVTINTTFGLLLHTVLSRRKHTSVYRALLSLLDKFLDKFGGMVPEVGFSIFEDCLSDPDTTKTLEILTHLLKAKVEVKQLVPTLLNKLESAQGGQLKELAELFGLALNNSDNETPFLIRFFKILDKLRNSAIDKYVKVLYYAQKGCPLCCNEFNFRMTMDNTRKLMGGEKTKCLQILTTFLTHCRSNEYIKDLFETLDLPELILDEHIEAFNMVKEGLQAMDDTVKRRLVGMIAGCCNHSILKVRRAACEVVLAALNDLLAPSESSQAKKAKLSSSHLIHCILSKDVYVKSVVKAVSIFCLDNDSGINSLARKGLAGHMSKNIGLRLTEAFLMAIYLPVTNASKVLDLSPCVAVSLDMIFAELKSQERFKVIRLREEPLENIVTTTGPPKLLSMASSYQGNLTLSSATVSGRKRKIIQRTTSDEPAIDVQITMEAILDTFLKFSKTTPEAAETFYIEILKSIKPQFELDPCLTECLMKIINLGPNDLTPFVVQVCEVMIEEISAVPNAINIVSQLQYSGSRSEGVSIGTCLYRNILLTNLKSDITLGTPKLESELDFCMADYSGFSIDDLCSHFRMLSDWDCLTIGDQRRFKKGTLPPFWTDAASFKTHVDNYVKQLSKSVDPHLLWFDKMASAYKQEHKELSVKWFRELDQWPRRQFNVSAITEAITWLTRNEDCDQYNLCDIHPSDCLAEWAARLMLRHAHNATLQRSAAEEMRARDLERQWCTIANGRGLSSLVLECVERNVSAGGEQLFETETLPWLVEKVTARRDISYDKDTVVSLMEVAKNGLQEFASVSRVDDVLSMQRFIMLLHRDIYGLSDEVTQQSLALLDSYLPRKAEIKNKDNIVDICKLALSYYKGPLRENLENSFKEMVSIVNRLKNSGISDIGYLAVLLTKLDDVTGTLDNDTAKNLLDLVQQYSLDEFTRSYIQKHRNVFPVRVSYAYPCLWEGDSNVLSVHKRYLELVCDAEFALQQYCVELLAALGNRDVEKWQSTVRRMKAKIFENPHAGSSYQLLNKYRSRLYEIAEFDPSNHSPSVERRLQDLCRELQRAPQSTLRLSQLCPALARSTHCAGALLGLRESVTVVKFYEQVQVYTDSVRRPVVLKVLTSEGATRRYMVKSGEPLQTDAAAQAALAYAGELWKPLAMRVIGYSVIPLAEDSGLIEFLEDTERIRDLIKESFDLDAVLSSDTSYSPARARTPCTALRRAIMRRALTAQAAVGALRAAGQTMATSTLITWVLGLGDRHLENILYRSQDGGVCHVDWAQAFDFGLRESVPARLTANLRALCDDTELECYLQRLLTALRESSDRFYAVLRISFNWMGKDFLRQLSNVSGLVDGTARSVDITKEVIQASDMADADKEAVVHTLTEAFYDYPQKDNYTVEEQISCFLHHCTYDEILSTCRRPWEPWA